MIKTTITINISYHDQQREKMKMKEREKFCIILLLRRFYGANIVDKVSQLSTVKYICPIYYAHLQSFLPFLFLKCFKYVFVLDFVKISISKFFLP